MRDFILVILSTLFLITVVLYMATVQGQDLQAGITQKRDVCQYDVHETLVKTNAELTWAKEKDVVWQLDVTDGNAILSADNGALAASKVSGNTYTFYQRSKTLYGLYDEYIQFRINENFLFGETLIFKTTGKKVLFARYNLQGKARC